MKRRNNAFTLIELLTTMAILAILASILLPVFAQARNAAQRSVCISNHKQLSLALLAYTDDNQGVFPGYVQDTWYRMGDDTPIWSGMIQPYLKSQGVFTCPRANRASKFGGFWGDRGWLSLGYNTNFGLWIYGGEPLRVNQSAMDKPSRNVLLADSVPGSHNEGYRGYITNAWNPREGACGVSTVINGTGATLTDRHEGGANVTLADGHTVFRRVSTLVPVGQASANDWCQCVVDKNTSKFKWLVHYACQTD